MELWWDPFIQSRKIMSSKFTGELCFMTMKSDLQNLKRNWLVNSKLTWGIWQILTRALENPKNVDFNRLLLTRVCNAWPKQSIEELRLMALKLMQNLKETGLCFVKFSFTGWKIVISFYKVKWQNLLKAERTDSLWKLPGCSLFSQVGIGWWTLL